MIVAMPNVDGVSTARTGKVEATARCTSCDWGTTVVAGAEWLALRARARRHVQATGHEVRAELTTFYVYAPDARSGR